MSFEGDEFGLRTSWHLRQPTCGNPGQPHQRPRKTGYKLDELSGMARVRSVIPGIIRDLHAIGWMWPLRRLAASAAVYLAAVSALGSAPRWTAAAVQLAAARRCAFLRRFVGNFQFIRVLHR